MLYYLFPIPFNKQMLEEKETTHHSLFQVNQTTYSNNPGGNAQFDKTNSTIYYVERTLERIITKFLIKKRKENPNFEKINLFDFGCGDGLSLQMAIEILIKQGVKRENINAHGIDVNKDHLAAAKNRVPDAKTLKHIQENNADDLKEYKNFDLVICSFVLLEQFDKSKLEAIPKLIKGILAKNGQAIFVNNSSNVYRSELDFPGVNNKKCNSREWIKVSKKGKSLPNDGSAFEVSVFIPDKLEHDKFFADKNNKEYPYTDGYWSGKAYLEAFKKAGLKVVDTIKPKREPTDRLQWESYTEQDKPSATENNLKARKFHDGLFSLYKIHVVEIGEDSHAKKIINPIQP